MPSWFKQEWLDIEEAPTNTWWRQQGLSAYKQDTSWLGESAPSTSGGGVDDGSSSGGGPGGLGCATGAVSGLNKQTHSCMHTHCCGPSGCV